MECCNSFLNFAGTIFYGTHLKRQKQSAHPKIHYVVPGKVEEIA